MLLQSRTVRFESPRRFIGSQVTTPSSFNPEISDTNNMVPQLIEKVRAALLDQRISTDCDFFGISWPADELSPPMMINFFAGIESDIAGDDDFEEIVVTPGNYFATTYEGSMANFDEAIIEIYGPTLENSGHQVRDGLHLEIYGSGFDPNSETSLVDVLIPVQ